MSRMAVVVVNHDGGQEVLECLEGALREDPAEVVVVDNASTDGSREAIGRRFDGVRLVRNERNVGFGPAVNQGVAACTAPYVALLNQDATLREGALASLERVLDDNPAAAVVGAQVRNPDGSVQPTRRSFPSLGQSILHGLVGIFRRTNPGTRAYVMDDVVFDAPGAVDWVAGTAVALRREAFEAVGGFDEDFFFFVEDVDLCKRLWSAGWQVWFDPGAEVVHTWGGSWTRRPIRFLWIHQWNLFRYVRKHYRGGWVLLYPAIAAGLLLRFVLLALRWLITRRSVPGHRSTGGNR